MSTRAVGYTGHRLNVGDAALWFAWGASQLLPIPKVEATVTKTFSVFCLAHTMRTKMEVP
jgi:hypothetical protein